MSLYGNKDWSSGGGLSRASVPRGWPPVHARVKRKKGGGRKKEELRKNESGKWKKVQEASEHASGQMPCEFYFSRNRWQLFDLWNFLTWKPAVIVRASSAQGTVYAGGAPQVSTKTRCWSSEFRKLGLHLRPLGVAVWGIRLRTTCDSEPPPVGRKIKAPWS